VVVKGPPTAAISEASPVTERMCRVTERGDSPNERGIGVLRNPNASKDALIDDGGACKTVLSPQPCFRLASGLTCRARLGRNSVLATGRRQEHISSTVEIQREASAQEAGFFSQPSLNRRV
jgi:hypothetical protein